MPHLRPKHKSLFELFNHLGFADFRRGGEFIEPFVDHPLSSNRRPFVCKLLGQQAYLANQPPSISHEYPYPTAFLDGYAQEQFEFGGAVQALKAMTARGL